MSSIGVGNVAVSFADSTYTIGFIGALAGKNVPTLALSAISVTPQNEKQKVQLINATGGSFTLTIAYTDGGNHLTGKTTPINYGATAADVKSATWGHDDQRQCARRRDFNVFRVGSTYVFDSRACSAAATSTTRWSATRDAS